MDQKEAKEKYERADALYRQKRYQEALAILDDLDKAFPNTKNIMYPRALCLGQLGRIDEALDVCTRLITILGDPRGEQLKAELEAQRTGAEAAPSTGAPGAQERGKRTKLLLAGSVVAVCLIVATGVLLFRQKEPSTPAPAAEVIRTAAAPLGKFYVRDKNSNTGWEYFADAVPNVVPPSGKEVRLEVASSAKLSRLGELILGQVSALELGSVALSEGQTADAFLAIVERLSTLYDLGLGRYGSDKVISDNVLAGLENLPSLQNLDLRNSELASNDGLSHLAKVPSLQRLNLRGAKISDTELAHLAGATSLQEVILLYTQITDAGLAHLKGLTSLTNLVLIGTKVGDAGVAHLSGLTSLERLNLSHTQVGDGGMAHLKGLISLRMLILAATQVGDAGLAHLSGLTSLDFIHLYGTQVEDTGLAHLKDLTSLRGLNLMSTKVGDAGLEHLKGLTSLDGLYLSNTKVSDAGLAHLKGLTSLRQLYLANTKVSDGGLAALKEALPQCNIVH